MQTHTHACAHTYTCLLQKQCKLVVHSLPATQKQLEQFYIKLIFVIQEIDDHACQWHRLGPDNGEKLQETLNAVASTYDATRQKLKKLHDKCKTHFTFDKDGNFLTVLERLNNVCVVCFAL